MLQGVGREGDMGEELARSDKIDVRTAGLVRNVEMLSSVAVGIGAVVGFVGFLLGIGEVFATSPVDGSHPNVLAGIVTIAFSVAIGTLLVTLGRVAELLASYVHGTLVVAGVTDDFGVVLLAPNRFGVTVVQSGVGLEVTEVAPDSPAARGGCWLATASGR